MAQQYGLGRGLSSLIPQRKANDEKVSQPKDDFNYFGQKPPLTTPIKLSGMGVQELPLNLIIPNHRQPRFHFDELRLQELAESIKSQGILQPIVVSPQSGGKYEIIAGERRFRASERAGLKTIPVIIKETDDQQRLELAIMENVQRHDLNAIEEAKSYAELEKTFNLTQEEIAKKIGKSRSAVANKMRLLQLPVEIQKALMEGKISEGHAKAILALDNPEKQRALFQLILKQNLTVREVEDKAKEVNVGAHKRLAPIDQDAKELEKNLVGALGTKVKISRHGQGGKITIDFYSPEELQNIVGRIAKSN